jgi:hypothetical protein
VRTANGNPCLYNTAANYGQGVWRRCGAVAAAIKGGPSRGAWWRHHEGATCQREVHATTSNAEKGDLA